MKAEIKKLGGKRWRAKVWDEKTTWHMEWNPQTKRWDIIRATGELHRDPAIKPLMLEAIRREWGRSISELILEE